MEPRQCEVSMFLSTRPFPLLIALEGHYVLWHVLAIRKRLSLGVWLDHRPSCRVLHSRVLWHLQPCLIWVDLHGQRHLRWWHLRHLYRYTYRRSFHTRDSYFHAVLEYTHEQKRWWHSHHGEPLQRVGQSGYASRDLQLSNCCDRGL